MSEDTAALERWIARRDAKAFREVALRHAGMVYGVCRRILGNAVDAEDVAQECFEALAQAERVPRSGSVGAWLHGVATKRALKRIRTENRRRARESRFAADQPERADIEWDDVYGYVDEALAELPDHLRGPVVAHYLEGHPHAEIATESGIPRRTISYRIEKGIERIREALKHKGVPVASAALASMMVAHGAEAAPAALTATVGKLALAGVKGIGTSAGVGGALKLGLLGGVVMTTKKVLIAVGVVAAVLASAFWIRGALQTEPAVEPGPGTRAPNTASPAEHATESSIPPKEEEVAAVAEEAASEAAPAAAPQPEEPMRIRATVHGTVVDTQDNPVAGADVVVTLANDPNGFDIFERMTTQTDAAGVFELSGEVPVTIAFGSARVYAGAEGFLQANKQVQALNPNIEIHFVLEPAPYFVSGQVVAKTRQGVPEALVALYCQGYGPESDGHGVRSSQPLAFATTDEGGYFRIAIHSKGLCDFLVTREGYGTGLFEGIATGTENAVFMLDSSGTIRGRVIDKEGNGVSAATVTVSGEIFASRANEVKRTGARYPHRPFTVTSGTDGGYTVDGLGAGFGYQIAAVAPDGKARAKTLKGVRVTAGQMTPGVDLVLAALPATVSGKVTDTKSGNPIHPLRLVLEPVNPEEAVADPRFLAVADTRTQVDGSYRMTVNDLTEPTEFYVPYYYVNEGGSSNWGQREETMAGPVELVPGEEVHFDFTIDAPFNVSVRFVEESGQPIEGLRWLLRRGGGRGGCGGDVSDADGYLTLHGLMPAVTYEIVGSLPIESPSGFDKAFLGVSEPFTGESGETLDLTVVCRSPDSVGLGGLRGVVADADGNPVEGVSVTCVVNAVDDVEHINVRTNADGSIEFPGSLPDGDYPSIVVYIEDEASGQAQVAQVRNIQVERGETTDLGVVALQPIDADELEAVIRGR